MAELSIEVDGDEAQRAVRQWRKIVGQDAAENVVKQISTLAERHMKEEAPRGAGIPNVNLRTTISAEQVGDDPIQMMVKPRKRTQDGWLLHRAIVGEPSTPTYGDTRPPIDPLKQWAGAKLGDPQAAWPIREKIYQEGQRSFPNPFIDRSIERWQNQVQRVSEDAVDEAFRGGF